mgnify:CR=1 FL=1
MTKKKKLIIAAVFLLLGLVVFPLASFTFIKSGHKAEKISLPGAVTLDCKEQGAYILWYDYQAGQTLSPVDGKFELQLQRQEDGMFMPIEVNQDSFGLKRGEFHSVSFASFQIERVGKYQLTLKDVKGEGSFSFGKSRSLQTIIALAVGLLGCVFSVIVACLILVVCYVPAFQQQKQS